MEADLAALLAAPPALDDSHVRYDLFLLRPPSAPLPEGSALAAPPLEKAHEGEGEGKDDDEGEERAFVERAREDMLAFTARETRGFLWQRDRFHLRTRRLPGFLRGLRGLRGWYLAGESAVGDAVMDAWVLARLVFALSRRDPLLVARLQDADGEFLLIEAAAALPDWVSPDNSAGRVLVRAGRVHIHRPKDPEGGGARVRRGSTDAALADALGAMADGASGAFEAGEPMQRALASKLERETPVYMRENRHRARCLLPPRAALVLAHRPALVAPAVEAFYYREPARAGPTCARMAVLGPPDAAVERRVAFSRAMFAQLKQQRFHPPACFLAAPQSRYRVLLAPSAADAARWKAADLGVKLACGLELLYAEEGARDQFGASYRELIDGVLAAQDTGEAADDSSDLEDDDEAWMSVHPDELEERLADLGRRFERSESGDEGAGDAGGAEELQEVAAMFGAFLGGESGVDGVQGAAPVQLDMAAFMDILQGASGGQGDNDSDSGEDDSDEDDSNDGGDEEDAALVEAMAEMEAELADSTLAKSFVRPEGLGVSTGAEDGGLDEEEEKEEEAQKLPVTPETPLDLDFNLLSNLLESFASQDGQAGPVSSILGELRLPRAAEQ